MLFRSTTHQVENIHVYVTVVSGDLRFNNNKLKAQLTSESNLFLSGTLIEDRQFLTSQPSLTKTCLAM